MQHVLEHIKYVFIIYNIISTLNLLAAMTKGLYLFISSIRHFIGTCLLIKTHDLFLRMGHSFDIHDIASSTPGGGMPYIKYEAFID